MKVKFSQPHYIGGVDYQPGVHEVPDHFRTHWSMLAWVQNGTATILSGSGKSPQQMKQTAPEQADSKPEKADDIPSYEEQIQKFEGGEVSAKQPQDMTDEEMKKAKAKAAAAKGAATKKANAAKAQKDAAAIQ